MTAALTLTAPYGTLIAMGVKGPETRGAPPAGPMCPPGVRAMPGRALERGDRLVIHQGVARPALGDYGEFVVDPPGAGGCTMTRLRRPGIHDGHRDQRWTLHLGAVVATCLIADAVLMVEHRPSIIDTPPGRWLSVHEHAPMVLHECDAYGMRSTPFANDARPYGDYRAGRWAWLLDDVKPTTDRCPWCWGTGFRPDCGHPEPSGLHHVGCRCNVCPEFHHGRGSGLCDPVPARGRQGVWEWSP